MLKKIFTIERIIWLVLLLAAVIFGLFYFNLSKNYKENYNIAIQNEKAYALQLDKEKAHSNVFKIKIEQLTYYNDSITAVLNNAKNELKIKDKQLTSLSYLATQVKKTDTIRLTDTIFKEQTFVLDTIVGDKWVSTKLYMEYPSEVVLQSTVVSEKSVIMYIEKEYVDPPKKCWFLRLFQKKHTVLKAVVKENNPYVTDQENVFFQIIE